MDDWLDELGVRAGLMEGVDLAIVLAAATLVYFLVRGGLVRATRRFAASTSTHWDDEIVKAGVFSRIAYIAPAFVVYYGMGFFQEFPEELVDGIRRLAVAVMIAMSALGLSSFLHAAESPWV